MRCWHWWRRRDTRYTERLTCYPCRVRKARKRMGSVL